MTSEFDRKYDKAIEELKSSAIWRSSFDPPAHRVLRHVNIKLRPPHYNSFAVNTVSISVYFFIAVFLVISLVTSRSSDVTLASAVVKAMSIGMLGGLRHLEPAAGQHVHAVCYGLLQMNWRLRERADQPPLQAR